MTTGSYDRGVYSTVSGGRVGYRETRSWNGTDSPRAPRLDMGTYTTVRQVRRRDGSYYYKDIVVRYPRVETPIRLRETENPYSMSYTRFVNPAVYKNPYLSYSPWSFEYVATYGATQGTADLLGSNGQIALVGKLREKLYGSDFNVSVFLGEGRQSLALIGDSAIRLAKAAYHAKRGDISGAARSLLEGTSRAPLRKRHQWDARKPQQSLYPNLRSDTRQTANLWLELQYGWLPILNDMKTGAEQLAHHLSVPMQTSYRVNAAAERLSIGTSDSTTNGCGKVTSTVVLRHKRWLIARIQEVDHPSMWRKLGLLDPELVAWELVPFSFVADWGIPISAWMEARALSKSLVGKFITADLKTREWSSGSVKQTPGVRGTYLRTPLPPAYRVDAQFSRTVASTLSVPMPEMKPLSKVASWAHVTNALALVTQIFTRRETILKEPQRALLAVPNRLPESYWSL